MNVVVVNESDLLKAAEKGMDQFILVFVDAINKAIGNELTAENMAKLNADQITLLAYVILRDEVMDGGFVQLIHNGYGPFIFKNPFSKMMRKWGIDPLASMINKAHKSFTHFHEEIEKECSDDEFMALFEKFPVFDDYDDDFVENEEQWTNMVACYIDEHIEDFAVIKK
ncbi:MAG: DMP19 family protein [Prevotella sp.]|nr:DMP19 family protein [Prevotella sp.]